MIEANTQNNGSFEQAKEMTEQSATPVITVSGVLEDLENGIDRKGIQEKYGITAWEVKQIFEHPKLKGKKVKKVKKLSFTFIDDTPSESENEGNDQGSVNYETTSL